MSEEIRVAAEVIVLAMLENKNTFFIENVASEYEVRYLFQLFERIWRVGKNQVITGRATAYETENVIPDHFPIVVFQRLRAFLEVGEV